VVEARIERDEVRQETLEPQAAEARPHGGTARAREQDGAEVSAQIRGRVVGAAAQRGDRSQQSGGIGPDAPSGLEPRGLDREDVVDVGIAREGGRAPGRREDVEDRAGVRPSQRADRGRREQQIARVVGRMRRIRARGPVPAERRMSLRGSPTNGAAATSSARATLRARAPWLR
jgi:hypothetical protein